MHNSSPQLQCNKLDIGTSTHASAISCLLSASLFLPLPRGVQRHVTDVLSPLVGRIRKRRPCTKCAIGLPSLEGSDSETAACQTVEQISLSNVFYWIYNCDCRLLQFLTNSTLQSIRQITPLHAFASISRHLLAIGHLWVTITMSLTADS